MIGVRAFSDIREFGNQRKVSVARLVTSRTKPDLAFKVPTCLYRDSSFTLHGKVGLLYHSDGTG